MGYIKLNSDASVSETDGCGIGCLARNADGDTLLIASKKIKKCNKVEVAEAEGFLWALELALEQGWPKIWMESDCKNLIYKLQKDRVIRGELAGIIKKIRVLSSMFAECRWSNVRRQENAAADFLANIRPQSCIISTHSRLIPFALLELLENDLN